MGQELWGSFSVKDHCRPNAYVREVLLFDRLVLPVPADSAERHRWEQPNDKDPQKTWNPGRLDKLIEILGSQQLQAQSAPQHGWRRKLASLRGHPTPSPPPGALTWQSPWDLQRWQFEQSRLAVANALSGNPYADTAGILTQDPNLPKVIEAVAAFPSEKECREELKPGDSPPDPTAAEALLMLAAPLLIPSGEEGKDFGPLRAAAELARENQFRKERQAYYDWMRAFVKPLQSAEGKLHAVKLDKGSLELAQERLQDLVASERQFLAKWERRRWWKRTEYALTVIGVGTAVGVALPAALPLLGVAAPLIGFGGWLAGKRATPEQLAERPLGGASMFVSAQRHPGWQK